MNLVIKSYVELRGPPGRCKNCENSKNGLFWKSKAAFPSFFTQLIEVR